MKYDVVIVGGGVAGLTAAAYLAKAGKKIVLFEKQDKVGGLIQTFQRNGVYFDGGLRSIENSGIVFPMLKQLGIEIEFTQSPISIGIENKVIKLSDKYSVVEYEEFLKAFYPENEADVEAIISEVKKIMGYMDVLYGIDNPAFLDFKKDKKYLLTTILPWVFKFLVTIGKINRLNEPVEFFLSKMSKNQSLIDIIAQHFFKHTPTSFALSYFSLYLDYHYPKGGTAMLIQKLSEFISNHGGEIRTSTSIVSLNPEQKFVVDSAGIKTYYEQLIWAADMKFLYNAIPVESLKNNKLSKLVEQNKQTLKNLRGGDSVYTIYYTLNEESAYFERICTGHFFYTPKKEGLSSVSRVEIDKFLLLPTVDSENVALKEMVKQYLTDYFLYNTFEVAIPALRDPSLAPQGKTGVVISLLYEYDLAKKIEEFGWSHEIKLHLEEITAKIMDESIFPDFSKKIESCFSSSPVTIEKLTGNTDGGITGWAFTNPIMPSVNKMLQVSKSVLTPLPAVFQAGQWVYSPAGMPISILTGKLAADKVLESK